VSLRFKFAGPIARWRQPLIGEVSFSEDSDEPGHPESSPEVELSSNSNVAPLRDDPSRRRVEIGVERHDWLSTNGRPRRDVTRGHYKRKADSKISTTDPDASMMRRAGRSSHPGYHVHYVVDGGKARVILQALVTPSEVMENQPMLDLLWRSHFRWRIRPRQVTGDTTYGTLENIKAIEDAGIRAYLPLPDFDKRTPFFVKNEFVYEAGREVYVCPQGEDLNRYTLVNRDRVVKYKADPTVCNACPLKSDCTTSSKGRLVSRSFDEAYLDMVRAYHLTEPYKKAMRKRKVWVEPMFAEAKCWHGLRRFRLRRLERVNIEALLTAAGQNLKRLLTFGKRRPKAPAQAAALRSPTVVDYETHHAREHHTTLFWWPARPFLNTLHHYRKRHRCPQGQFAGGKPGPEKWAGGASPPKPPRAFPRVLRPPEASKGVPPVAIVIHV